MTISNMDDMVTNPIQPKPQNLTFFGQIVILDRSNWKLVRGQGRQVFDHTYDDPKDLIRGITLAIECEKRSGEKYTIDTGRLPLLEIDKAWHKHLLPSLQKLGVSLSQLKSAFVQVKRIETGETYTKANSDGTSETKHKTALELVAVYPDWHAMNSARDALFGQGRTEATPAAPANTLALDSTPTLDKEALAKLLPGLWMAAGRNKDVFAAMFNGNPNFANAFTLDEALQAATLPF